MGKSISHQKKEKSKVQNLTLTFQQMVSDGRFFVLVSVSFLKVALLLILFLFTISF